MFSSNDTNKAGMSEDAIIELPDGQSLSLRKIGNQFDPVVLTYSHSLTEEQNYDSMVFSIGEYQSVHKNDRDLA